MNCIFCNNYSIKKGIRNSIQKWYCKTCKKHFQSNYKNKLCTALDEKTIIRLNNEGMVISSISRITGISKSNVVNKIKLIGFKITKPVIKESQQKYEIDEMHTYIKDKNQSCYITYALNRSTKQIIDFIIGSRTKENIRKVINSVKQLNPKRIFTDKLNVYPGLIEKSIHTANSYSINHIERFNLTLRTHLKRLSRKTICFSKSKAMLENCLRIYLWSKA